MRTSNHAENTACSLGKVALILWIVSLIAGCATPASQEGMTASAPPASAGIAIPNELRGQIAVGNVAGGKGTNPMWVSSISDEDFQAALESSLRNAGLGAANRNSGRYVLMATLQRVQQPLAGFNMTVTTTIGYTLAERGTNKSLWTRTVTRAYTARPGDAFYGPTRLRLANEGSAKANIEELIGELMKAYAGK
jgi:hypothetical protein